MAVEKTESGLLITGVHIQVFQLIRVAHGLALEVNIPGMKVSRGGSIMQLAASYCGSSKRTKKGVLRDYVAFLKANLPGGWEPSASIAKAMEK